MRGGQRQLWLGVGAVVMATWLAVSDGPIEAQVTAGFAARARKEFLCSDEGFGFPAGCSG